MIIIFHSLLGKSFISVLLRSVSGYLPRFFVCNIFLTSSFFLILCLSFCALNKTATSPVLTHWPHVGEPQQSALPEHLVAPQASGIAQAAFFVPSGSQ